MNRAVIISFLILFAGIILLRERQWIDIYGVGIPAGSRLRLTTPLKVTVSKCILDIMGWEVVIPKNVCSKSKVAQLEVGDQVVFIGSCTRQVIQQQSYKKYSCITQNIQPIFLSSESVFSWWKWQRKLLKLRSNLVEIVQKTLSEPQASLVAGVVLGEQGSLPTDFYKALQVTGTMHIVAASGYNVAVIIGIGLAIGVRLFGRKGGLLAAMISVIVYVLLSGASPPLLRAGLMGLVMMIGVYFGREYWSLYSLGIVAGLLLAWQPWLMYSLSFQLSVAATIGVIGGSRVIGNMIRRMFGLQLEGIWVGVVEAFATTVAASIATWPLTIMAFEEASVWGLMVNPLVLWLIPPLMYLGLLLMFLGIIWLPLAALLSWTVNPLATLFVEVIRFIGLRADSMTITINWLMAMGWWLIWIGLAYGIAKHD